MPIFSVPNPSKKVQIDFSIEKVKESVKNINLVNKKYKFESSVELANLYTYESLEFLSLGVFIDINLISLGVDKTEVNIEVRRKVGTFDQNHEVTKAHGHINEMIKIISLLLTKSKEDIDLLKNPINVECVNWYDKKWLVFLLCWLFFPIGFYGLWKNKSISLITKSILTLLLIFFLYYATK